MTRPMPFQRLRLACAELAATKAMRLEAERERAEAELVRALARRRVTQRPSRWSDADRKTWGRHVEIQKSLKALRADYDRKPPSNTPVQLLPRLRMPDSTCPACHDSK